MALENLFQRGCEWTAVDMPPFDETETAAVTGEFSYGVLKVFPVRGFGMALESLEEVEREKIGFLREVLGALPVRGLYSLLCLIEEAANFIDHVFLRGVEVVAVSVV